MTTQKLGSFLLGAIVFMIIIGFVFTGFQGSNNVTSTNLVSEVDGTPITYKEYQLLLNQEIQRATQVFGNRNLSKQEISMLSQRILGQLIQKKVLSNFVKNHNAFPAGKEVSKQIKELPYFQTNKQFDVTKYKQLLQANRINPTDFEKQIAEDLAIGKFSQFIFQFPLSQNYRDDLKRLNNLGSMLNVYTIENKKVNSTIDIPKKDIEAFLADEKNLKSIENLYNRNINRYEKPEERNARHILFSINEKQNEADALKKANEISKKLTASNFNSLANKNTDDPSGKKNGGSLGWFRKGIMDPAFEDAVFSMKKGEISKPIKTSFGYHIIKLDGIKKEVITPLESVKEELAKESLLSKKSKETKELVSTHANNLKEYLEKNNQSSVKNLTNKAKTEVAKNIKLDIITANILGVKLKTEKAFEIIKSDNNSVFIIEEPLKTLVVQKIKPLEAPKDKNQDEKKHEKNIEEQKVAYSVYNDLINHLSEKATIKTNPQFQNAQ